MKKLRQLPPCECGATSRWSYDPQEDVYRCRACSSTVSGPDMVKAMREVEVDNGA